VHDDCGHRVSYSGDAFHFPGATTYLSFTPCASNQDDNDRLKRHSSPRQASGRSSRCALVCWLFAGWNRSAEFELALHCSAEFGLSRFSASRGLDELERADLASVGRMLGGSRVVTILEAYAPNG
jgi:hypothetical protein